MAYFPGPSKLCGIHLVSHKRKHRDERALLSMFGRSGNMGSGNPLWSRLTRSHWRRSMIGESGKNSTLTFLLLRKKLTPYHAQGDAGWTLKRRKILNG